MFDERSRGPAVLFTSNQSQLETTTLPFVIRSEAEGPAVLFTSNQSQLETTTLPLSSRAKPRDLRFSSPATNSQLETPLSLCHPECWMGLGPT